MRARWRSACARLSLRTQPDGTSSDTLSSEYQIYGHASKQAILVSLRAWSKRDTCGLLFSCSASASTRFERSLGHATTRVCKELQPQAG
jgi:hypothetical protein